MPIYVDGVDQRAISTVNLTLLRRKHVLRPQDWGQSAGTDFWGFLGDDDILGVAGRPGLADFGWTTTALAVSQGGATDADFLTAADESANLGIQFNASGDLLQSPIIFGNYGHARMVQGLLGSLPTKLVLEAYAKLYVDSANETTSGFGFIEDAGSPAVAADQLAYIYSDSANYKIRNGAGANDVGAAIDADWHLWRIEVTATGIEWFIDGTSQGTIALETDEFPVSFGAHTFTTNRLMFAWVHVYYA